MSVIDYAPSPVGPPEAIADYVLSGFEAGLADGFWLQQATYADADEFVVQVVRLDQRSMVFVLLVTGLQRTPSVPPRLPGIHTSGAPGRSPAGRRGPAHPLTGCTQEHRQSH